MIKKALKKELFMEIKCSTPTTKISHQYSTIPHSHPFRFHLLTPFKNPAAYADRSTF